MITAYENISLAFGLFHKSNHPSEYLEEEPKIINPIKTLNLMYWKEKDTNAEMK